MQDEQITRMYEQLGISKDVYRFGTQIEEKLRDRFEAIDRTAEYNQLKVIHAMQENRVSEGCFHYTSGYGYDDMGRRCTPVCFTQRVPWCVLRSPAAPTPWL